MDLYLHEKPIPPERIIAAVRKGTLTLDIFPVMCGSALKHVGVRPLLDGITDFLPSPLEITPTKAVDISRKADDEEI